MLVHVQLDGAERSLSLAEFEDRVRRGTIGPHTPIQVESLAGGAWVAAGTSALFLGVAEGPESRARRLWMNPPIPWVTALVCGLSLRVYTWTASTEMEGAVLDRFSRWTPAIIEDRESWRLVTHAFLHGGFGHIANNMLLLVFCGVALETVVGGAAVAALFLVSVVGGGGLAAVLSPELPSVGASDADFGFIAGAVVFGWRYQDLLPPRIRHRFGVTLLALMAWALINGAMSPQVDTWAHTGGLLAGGAFMAFLRPRVDRDTLRWNHRVAGIASMGAVGAMVFAAAAGPSLVTWTALGEDGIATERPAYWKQGWTADRSMGWESPTHRSGIALRTEQKEDPVSVEAGVADLLARLTGPGVSPTVLARESVRVDGVPGERLSLSLGEGQPAWAAAIVMARGHYLHTLVVEAEREEFFDILVETTLGVLTVSDPKAVVAARAMGDGPRARAAQALALAEVGDVDGGLSRCEGVDPFLVRARLAILADARPEALDDAIGAAVAAFPEDRGVWLTAVEALDDADRIAAALALTERALEQWPGDRGFTRAARLIRQGPATEGVPPRVGPP